MRVNEYTLEGQLHSWKHSFNKWVLAVGDGNIHTLSKDGEEEPKFNLRQEDEEYLRESAILPLRNDDADQINKHMFKKLQGSTMTFKSSDEICKGSTDAIEQQQSYLIEFLNKMNFSGVPHHKLKLKIGSQ
ncbi:uncharacterized protein [Rutidosis leptorrhynchoides]|uniref:uncharacterized protein n=1 Tax=Rutidosis leptorrhynchoides TaxID=125765 RepID=UPI003A990E90